jgi:site-specific recombinase XerD
VVTWAVGGSGHRPPPLHEGQAGKPDGPLTSGSKAALATWFLTLRQLSGADPQPFVFRSRKGTNRPISRVQAWRILHEAVTTNELVGKLWTHAMRKTFANRVYHQLNHNLVKTQGALGHKHINSTVAYLSFVEDEIDQAILAS